MKLLLFILFTNLTIGSKVSFENDLFTVVDFRIISPFIERNSMFRVRWYKPLQFVVVLKNRYGGNEYVGSKVIKSIWNSKLPYNEIQTFLTS